MSCACSESDSSALELEQRLLLALAPPSALCLTPNPTVASEAAQLRLNDSRYQANRYNQRAHYNAAVSKVLGLSVLFSVVLSHFVPQFRLRQTRVDESSKRAPVKRDRQGRKAPDPLTPFLLNWLHPRSTNLQDHSVCSQGWRCWQQCSTDQYQRHQRQP